MKQSEGDTEKPSLNWQPIADAALLLESERVLADIVGAISDLLSPDRSPRGASRRRAGIAHGHAGFALLFAELVATDHPLALSVRAAERTLAEIDRAASFIADRPMPSGLLSGFEGVAATLVRLEGLLVEESDPPATREIDDLVLRHVGTVPWRLEYDLVSGLVGFGIYGLLRLPASPAEAIVAAVVRRLNDLAVRTAEGVAWHTPPRHLMPETAERFPGGYHDLGLAHGVPGVLAFLGQAVGAGIEAQRASGLFEQGATWLLRKRLPNSAGAAFAPFAEVNTPSRHAWCYGDPGVAAGLLVGARAAGFRGVEHAAVKLAIAAAARPAEESGVIDAGFCHGAAGLCHIFNRLYQATGHEALAHAARMWLRRTLDFRRPGAGIAGFRAWDGSRARGWWDDPGILTGAAGVGLTVLGATKGFEPGWDHLFLLAPAWRGAGLRK